MGTAEVRRQRASTVEVVPFVVAYNLVSTGPCINRCVEYPLGERPCGFGEAIEPMPLYPHFETRAPIISGLASMRGRFQASLVSLPFLWFRRRCSAHSRGEVVSRRDVRVELGEPHIPSPRP